LNRGKSPGLLNKDTEMRMLLYIVVLLVGLLAVVFGALGIIGSFIPVTHVAEVSVEVGSTGPQVWDVLNQIDAFPTWCPGVDRVEVLPGQPGHRRFRQYQGRNTFVLEETTSEQPTHVVRTIADDNKFFSGEWDHRIQDLGNGRCRVTVKETGSIPGAIPRAVMKLFFGYDFYLKKFAAALKAKCGA
jgi:uncharacterized membrane protein